MTVKGIEVQAERRKVRWLNWLASELEKTEKNFPISLLLDGEYPDWVRNVEREFVASLLPVKPKDLDEVTPKKIGALLGNECALAVWLVEFFCGNSEKISVELERSLKEPGFNLEKLLTKFRDERLPTEKNMQNVAAKWRLDKWYKAMYLLAQSALRSSVNQSYTVMSEFLLGFANGFARKPRTLNAAEMGKTTFEIYVFFMLYWRVVEQLKSVHELHQVLVKILGPYRAGDLKRIEKICQRIGLHYRKRGRPKTSRIIQTPT